MKKIIFLKEACVKKAIENWSVRKIAKQLGLKLTFNQYPSISDQEIEAWENIPKPWLLNAYAFKKTFFELNKNRGG